MKAKKLITLGILGPVIWIIAFALLNVLNTNPDNEPAFMPVVVLSILVIFPLCLCMLAIGIYRALTK